MGVEASTVVVFDLDDTLYKEVSYTESCFQFFSRELNLRFRVDVSAENLLARMKYGDHSPIQSVCVEKGLKEGQWMPILASMQSHLPDISLPVESMLLIDNLKSSQIPYGIITDGRSVTQRAKLQSLGLMDAAIVLISEEQGVCKPDERAFLPVMAMYNDCKLVYIADNPRKDFVAPNGLGWETVMLLDDGRNVHSQDIAVGKNFRAQHCVHRLSDVAALIGLH